MSTLVPQLLEFLQRLAEKSRSYSLAHNRDDAVMVLIAVPGERWEVEFFENGDIEVEIFRSEGKLYDEKVIERLFEQYSNEQNR